MIREKIVSGIILETIPASKLTTPIKRQPRCSF